MAGSSLSQKLRDKGRKISLIDRKLLPLLDQRLRIAWQIGKVKKQMGEKVYDPKREKEVPERLRLRDKGTLEKEDLENIFATIIKVCRQSQR